MPLSLDKKVWTCACGKSHAVNGTAIYCSGPGHSVYLSPQYFENEGIKAAVDVAKPKGFVLDAQPIGQKAQQTSLF